MTWWGGDTAGRTEHDTTSAAPSASNRAATSEQRSDAYWLLTAAALVTIGSFLPWAKIIAAFVGQISVSGVDGGDGYIALALAVPLVVFAVRRLSKGSAIPAVWSSVIAAALVALAVYEIAHLSRIVTQANKQAAGFAHASIGDGLWVLLAGAIIALVVSVKSITQRQSAHVAPIEPAWAPEGSNRPLEPMGASVPKHVEPRWDQVRNAWVAWEPTRGRWMQYDDQVNQWRAV